MDIRGVGDRVVCLDRGMGPTRPRLRPLSALLTLLAALCLLALPSAARASRTETTIIEDDPPLLIDPAGTLAAFRALGATTVRVVLPWSSIAPDPTSAAAPTSFD